LFAGRAFRLWGYISIKALSLSLGKKLSKWVNSTLFQFCICPALAFLYITTDRSPWLGIITSISQPGSLFLSLAFFLEAFGKNIKTGIIATYCCLIVSFSGLANTFISWFSVIEGLLGKERLAYCTC